MKHFVAVLAIDAMAGVLLQSMEALALSEEFRATRHCMDQVNADPA